MLLHDYYKKASFESFFYFTQDYSNEFYSYNQTKVRGDFMRIGYACICLNNDIPSFRTCIMKYVTEELLIEIIKHNLNVLDNILEYNYRHDILIFRLSSDLIPFGAHPINTLDWKTLFQEEWNVIGKKAKAYNMRLTMHPGQYTIINTPSQDVLARSVLDLRYHCDILNLMDMDYSNKLILHIGGIYGDKASAIDRFVKSFEALDDDIKQRLVIENDDRYYTLADVLYISEQLHIPVIFDNLHHEILPSLEAFTLKETLKLVQKTWKQQDGRMKIHYSQQDYLKRKGAHAVYLNGEAFLNFCKAINFMELDIMIEVKSKNLAANQAIELLDSTHFDFTKVWEHYRYLILDHSKELFLYLESSHKKLSAQQFYNIIHQVLEIPCDHGLICYQLIYE